MLARATSAIRVKFRRFKWHSRLVRGFWNQEKGNFQTLRKLRDISDSLKFTLSAICSDDCYAASLSWLAQWWYHINFSKEAIAFHRCFRCYRQSGMTTSRPNSSPMALTVLEQEVSKLVIWIGEWEWSMTTTPAIAQSRLWLLRKSLMNYNTSSKRVLLDHCGFSHTDAQSKCATLKTHKLME